MTNNGDRRPRALAVLREPTNSPNRESDDALILKAVLSELDRLGARVRLMTHREFDATDPAGYDLLLPMCESYPRLKRLYAIAEHHKTVIINPPEAVLGCYRRRMISLLSGHPRVPFPPSEMRPVGDGAGLPPRGFAAPPDGWWIKRGDVHNTCDRDVVRIRDWSEIYFVLQDFQSREITHYVVQPHVPGDLIKFYGVGPGRWSAWFYHDPDRVEGMPFETEDLASATAEAAQALGLEVYGGDAIVSPGRAITVIDINSWPSFAKVRGGAAPQIARHLFERARPTASARTA